MAFRFRVVAGAHTVPGDEHRGKLYKKDDLVASDMPLDTMFPGSYIKESVVERAAKAPPPAMPADPGRPAPDDESEAGPPPAADVSAEFPIAKDKGLGVTHDGESYAVVKGDEVLSDGLSKTAAKKFIKDYDPDEE